MIFSDLDVRLNGVIESKYLSHVTEKNEDCERIFHFFKEKFDTICANHIKKYSEKGMVMLPLHRNFAYILTRLLMKHYIVN